MNATDFKRKNGLRCMAEGGPVLLSSVSMRATEPDNTPAARQARLAAVSAPPPRPAPVEQRVRTASPTIGVRGATGGETGNLIKEAKKRVGLRHGGAVKGPGGPEDDLVPAKLGKKEFALSNGEYVLPKKSVDAAGGVAALDEFVLETNGKPPAGMRRKLWTGGGVWDETKKMASGMYEGAKKRLGMGAAPVVEAAAPAAEAAKAASTIFVDGAGVASTAAPASTEARLAAQAAQPSFVPEGGGAVRRFANKVVAPLAVAGMAGEAVAGAATSTSDEAAQNVEKRTGIRQSTIERAMDNPVFKTMIPGGDSKMRADIVTGMGNAALSAVGMGVDRSATTGAPAPGKSAQDMTAVPGNTAAPGQPPTNEVLRGSAGTPAAKADPREVAQWMEHIASGGTPPFNPTPAWEEAQRRSMANTAAMGVSGPAVAGQPVPAAAQPAGLRRPTYSLAPERDDPREARLNAAIDRATSRNPAEGVGGNFYTGNYAGNVAGVLQDRAKAKLLLAKYGVDTQDKTSRRRDSVSLLTNQLSNETSRDNNTDSNAASIKNNELTNQTSRQNNTDTNARTAADTQARIEQDRAKMRIENDEKGQAQLKDVFDRASETSTVDPKTGQRSVSKNPELRNRMEAYARNKVAGWEGLGASQRAEAWEKEVRHGFTLQELANDPKDGYNTLAKILQADKIMPALGEASNIPTTIRSIGKADLSDRVFQNTGALLGGPHITFANGKIFPLDQVLLHPEKRLGLEESLKNGMKHPDKKQAAHAKKVWADYQKAISKGDK